MSDFVLTCESAADRTREFFASRNIPVVCFHYEIDDVVYTDDLYPSATNGSQNSSYSPTLT